MGSKRSYFKYNFFIFLIKDFALPLMQILLLIFSKRLDNLRSVCGALDFTFFFWICRASIYRKYAFGLTAFSFLFVVLLDLFRNGFLRGETHFDFRMHCVTVTQIAWSPAPCYLRYFQILDKIDSLPKNSFNDLMIKKTNCTFAGLSNLYLILSSSFFNSFFF